MARAPLRTGTSGLGCPRLQNEACYCWLPVTRLLLLSWCRIYLGSAPAQGFSARRQPVAPALPFPLPKWERPRRTSLVALA